MKMNGKAAHKPNNVENHRVPVRLGVARSSTGESGECDNRTPAREMPMRSERAGANTDTALPSAHANGRDCITNVSNCSERKVRLLPELWQTVCL